jgi:Zn-dependent protease with chaperone function
VRLLVYLPLLIPGLAALAARPLAGRLEPRRATWLLTAAAVVLAGCAVAALALLAASAAAGLPAAAALGHYSQPVLRRADPGAAVTGLAASVLLAGAGVTAAIGLRRRARALAESYRRAARLREDAGLVIVPGNAIEAYALPGWPGRIVVSAALLAALDARERAALLAHERAHLAGRHHLFTTAAHLAAAACPLLLPLARAVDYTVERWADEDAARATGDRRLVAATIGRVALLTPPRRPRPGTAASLGAADRPRRVSVAWAGPVPRRVAALLGPPPARHAVLAAAVVAAVALTGLSALEAARDLHALLELARAAH